MTENTDSTFDGTTENRPQDDRPTETGPDIDRYAELGVLAAALVLALVASVGFYTNTSTAIERLVASRYEPIFQAVFNLVLLLVATAGVSLLWRRRQE